MAKGKPLTEKSNTLTRAGQKLAAIYLDPAYARASDRDRAKAAGISERHLHYLTADPDFQAALKARAIDFLRPKLQPILDAAAQTAMEPGRDGFKDRELLLQFAGWYAPREKHEISGPGGGPIQVSRVADLSNEELAKLAGGE